MRVLVLAEDEHLLRPGAEAPGAVLPVFYGYLEKQLGFTARWIRTDYRFPSLSEARRLVELFFGQMVDYELSEEGDVIVPECAGIWWKRR